MAGKLLQAERPQQALPPPRPVPGDVVPEPHHRRRSVCREHHRHRNHGQHPGVAVPQRRALRPRIFHPFDMPLGFLDQALHHRRRSFLLSSFKAGFPYQTVTMSYAVAVSSYEGMLIALPSKHWTVWRQANPCTLAETTVEFPHWAPHLCLGFDDFQDDIDWWQQTVCWRGVMNSMS